MGVKVTCCLCGKKFDERELVGSWLDRCCPLCNGKLSEELYDAAAARIQPGRGSRKRLRELAMARYYTSEWFRLACAGSGSDAPDKGLFGLEPDYDDARVFTLTPTDDDRSPEGGLGVSAEYFVFEAIRDEIVREGSPLEGTFLVPHLVFPWLPGQKPQQWGAKHRAEIDCVILTSTCAVVVEVKRRNHHVRASRDQQHIRERTEGGAFRSSSEIIEQVARGADSLAERQKLYSPDRILKMVVFVDPLSFEGAGKVFRDGWIVGYLGEGGTERLTHALAQAVSSFERLASSEEVRELGNRLLMEFGNVHARREGSIVAIGETRGMGRRSAAFLKALERRTLDDRSPLNGARLIKGIVCEVEAGKRGSKGKRQKKKLVKVAGLLLTRSHAILVDSRRWLVHVNTHAPFATVYTGEPEEGAGCVEAAIRHDWDLEKIHYHNRSGSLTLLTYAAKSIVELGDWRERNRVCSLHVFIDPASFVSDCDEFRQRTYLGFWRGAEENVMGALETLEEGASPIMTQAELDEFADSLT